MTDIFQALHQRIIGYARVNPDSVNQFILADQSPIVCYQVCKDLKRFWTKSNLFLSAQQAAASQVERETVETMDLTG